MFDLLVSFKNPFHECELYLERWVNVAVSSANALPIAAKRPINASLQPKTV